MKQIMVTAPRRAEIHDFVLPESALGPDSVGGPTLYTLVSAGTELNCLFLRGPEDGVESGLGYSAVFRAEYVGENARGIERGDILFMRGNHKSYQIADWRGVNRLPEGLAPEKALFARMAGVSMASLSRINAKPGDSVLVVGLGMVGCTALQAYAACGYKVTGVEPNARRAALVRELTGLKVMDSFPDAPGEFALALECSGTQQATLECARQVRRGGEISLVGVPWVQTGDVQSFTFLNLVFYKFLTVYSGWEMNLPDRVGPFQNCGQMDNYELALGWLKEGRMKVDGLYGIHPWDQAQAVYEAIADRRDPALSAIFDWRGSEEEEK